MSCISSNFSSFFLNSLNDPSEFSKYLSNGELRFANSNANNNHAINNMPTSTSLLSSAPIVDDFQVHSNHMVITQHQQQQHQQQISVNIMPSNHNLNVGIIGNASSQITNAEVTLNNALDNNAGKVNGVDSAGVNAERGFGIGADVPQNITAISTHNYGGNFASNNHHHSAHHLTQQQQQQQHQQQQQQQQQQQSRWPIPDATSSVIHSHHHQQLSTVHAAPTTGHLGANAQHFDGSFEFLKYLRHSNDFNQEHSNGDIGHDITAAQVAPPKHESMSTTTLNNASNFMDLDNNSNAHKVSRSSHKTNAALLSSITHTLNNNNGTVTPVAGVDAGTAAISTTPTPMIIDMYDHDSKHTTFDLQQHQQQLQQQQQQRMSQHYHIHNSTSVHSSHSSNESSSMELVTLNYANSQMNASNSNTSEEGGASVNGGGDFSTLTVSNNSSNHSSGSGVIVGTVASAVSPSAPKPLTAFTLKDNFDVHPSHKIEEGIFQHMNKLPPKKKENLKQLGVRFTGQMTVSDKSVIVENFIKFCQEYDIQDHRPFLSLNQSGLNKPEQIKFARYLGQGLPTFTLFCIYSNFKNLFCTKRTEIYTKDGYNLPYILEKTKQFLANTAAGNNNTNVNNTNNTNTSNTNTTNTIASNTNQNTCSSPTTVTTIIMATTTTTTSATITINNHNTVSSNNSIDNNNTNNNNNNNNINNTINIITTKAETTTNPSPPYGTSSVILSSNVASTTIPNNNRMHVTPNIYQGQAVNAVNSSKCNSNSNANKNNNNNNYNNNKFNSSNSNNEINSNKIHNSNNKMHHAIATQQQQQQQIHNVPLPLSSPLVSIGPTTTIRNPTHILHQPTTQHHNQQQQQQQVIHQHQQQQRQQQPIVNLTPPPTPIPMSTTIQPQHPPTPVHMMVTHQHPNQLHRVHTPMHTNLNQSSHHYHHHHQQQQQKQPSQFTRPQVVIVSQSMAQQQNQPLQHNLSQIAMGPVIAVGGTGNVNASGNGSVTIATPMLLSTQTPIQVTATATATVTAAPAAASTNVHIYAPSVTQPPPSPHALSSTSTNLQIQHYQQHHSHPLHISQPVTIYQQQQQQQQHILSTHSPHHIQQFTHINHHQQHLSAPTHHLIHNVVTPNGAAAATGTVGIGTTIATTVAISTATTRTISSPSQNMINRT